MIDYYKILRETGYLSPEGASEVSDILSSMTCENCFHCHTHKYMGHICSNPKSRVFRSDMTGITDLEYGCNKWSGK